MQFSNEPCIVRRVRVFDEFLIAQPLEKTVHFGDEIVINLIDALTVGPRPESAVEIALSSAWSYEFSNIYSALTRSGQELADDIVQDDWLQELRKARLDWIAAQEISSPNPATGKWSVRILDASDYPRPKTRTIKLGSVHGVDGMRLGHGLSLLSERVGEGSWTLPLEIGWIPADSHPLKLVGNL
jgi:hypothetical protein